MPATAPFKMLAATLLLSLLTACGKPPPPVAEVRPVRTLVVAPAATRLMNTYAGDVRARHESVLGFRVGGKISNRKVEVGSHVRRGEVLFTLDGSDIGLGAAAARAQVAQAEAQLKSAALDLQRYRDLQGKGYVSKSEFDRQLALVDTSKAQVAAAAANSAQFQNQTGYANLAADADGVVTAILAESGSVVAAGTPVVRIARDGDLEVASTIPEDQIGRVKQGMPVVVTLWIDGNTEVPGSVREVASAADPYTRTYAVRITLPKAPAAMRLGMTASVSIPLATPAMLHVPSSAMITRNQQVGVWVLTEALKARFQPIQIAGVEDNNVLVVGGLKPGDEVITAGAPLLTEGQQVKRLVPKLQLPAAAPAAAG